MAQLHLAVIIQIDRCKTVLALDGTVKLLKFLLIMSIITGAAAAAVGSQIMVVDL